MTRERRNAPTDSLGPRRQRQGAPPVAEPARRRGGDDPELELDDEEVRALADEGIDPDDVRRVAHERDQEASDHDRDTARDQVEGLVLEAQEY